MLREVRAFSNYALKLPGFLAQPVTWEQSRRQLTTALQSRQSNFLDLMERAVFANPGSPYRMLLEHAGFGLSNVTRLIREHDIEGGLARLHDAGVYVSHDELKGHARLERPGLSREIKTEDFDNPLLGAVVRGTTGASRGRGTPIPLDLDHLTYRAAYDWATAMAHGDVDGRPVALWRPIPPGVAGLNSALLLAKRRIPIEKWFAQNGGAVRHGHYKGFLLMAWTVLASRASGTRIPIPEHTPATEAATVARWLAAKTDQGAPALLNASASSCVRVCLAAREHALSIDGTLFRVGGEPFTEAKARVVKERGCRALVHYGMTEVGRIGLPCAAPLMLDDVHLAIDRLAVIQRPRDLGRGIGSVGAFHLTTLHPGAPTLLINAETGDYGTVDDRDCGCAIGDIGFSRHLHSIRSYEKLNSEGMRFLGEELIFALEQVLPARFGGSPSDYQLVEEEVGGLPRVHLVVSARVGSVDEEKLVSCLLETLGKGAESLEMMAAVWKEAQTLRVERREPYMTASAKVLPLHVLGK